ncbi:hypothetical protein L1887_28480 [Cichorium endivia]|nr:hypothetical protein L1887_28480 [Cichorium endivia]
MRAVISLVGGRLAAKNREAMLRSVAVGIEAGRVFFPPLLCFCRYSQPPVAFGCRNCYYSTTIVAIYQVDIYDFESPPPKP